MTNILENTLVMVVLAALILIPVVIVKRSNRKKKQELLQNKLDSITADNNCKLTRTGSIGNLLLAFSDKRKLILLNLIDFTYELIDLEKVISVKEEISYNGKEVRNVMLLLSFANGAKKEIVLYKQYDSSESELPSAKKMAKEWVLLLAVPA
ncbi:hypothetical protein [Pedobacter arcticus]|uniref:hypothetical protein n=1 Tax=Pedobacter arcticus TaxID=752140 RepID=UPI0002DC7C4E|nr:hypothetical protein [Pedobacter arcticus]